MKKFLTRLKKPADLNIATIVKIISDWAVWLKKISPLAGTLFILLNVGTLLKKRASLVTIFILLPLLFITRRVDVLRVIFAISLFWIFFDKFTTGIGKLDRRLAALISLYSIVILLGIFVPSFYIWDGSFRFKFMLESHNALCILVFLIFIYLCETLLQTISSPPQRQFKTLIIIAIFALIVVFLFIKARLYLGLSFTYLCIIAIKRWRQIPVLAVFPIAYAGAFIMLLILSRQISRKMDAETFAKVKQEMIDPASLASGNDFSSSTDPDSLVSSSDPSGNSPKGKRNVPKRSEIAAVLVMNQRVTNSSTTGRWQLIDAFTKTFRQLGWKKFLYANNVESYLENKRRIPFINIKASSLVENTYCATLLTAGFAGLILILYMAGLYFGHFLRRKELLSLVFFSLLLAVWMFEESTMFTLSLMAHLFALATINRLEKEDHESSNGN